MLQGQIIPPSEVYFCLLLSLDFGYLRWSCRGDELFSEIKPKDKIQMCELQ